MQDMKAAGESGGGQAWRTGKRVKLEQAVIQRPASASASPPHAPHPHSQLTPRHIVVMASVTEDPRLIQIYQFSGNAPSQYRLPVSWTWSLETNLNSVDDSGSWLQASNSTAQEDSVITAQKGYILWLPWTYVSKHRWSSEIIRQLKTSMLAVTIKGSLNAYCVQSPVLSSWGVSKKVWTVLLSTDWLSL